MVCFLINIKKLLNKKKDIWKTKDSFYNRIDNLNV